MDTVPQGRGQGIATRAIGAPDRFIADDRGALFSGAISNDSLLTAADDVAASRWADLVSMICEPAHGARMLELNGQHNGGRPIAEGTAEELLLQAERGGGGVAVVAPMRPDLVAVDLDGCADLVLPDLMTRADDLAGALVYLAASGSPDSVHAVFACATVHGRAALAKSVGTLRSWHGLDASQVDLRTGAGGAFRLPGSVSLKGGGPVQPIAEDGRRLNGVQASSRAYAALTAAGLPITPPAPDRRSTAAPATRNTGQRTRLGVVDVRDDGTAIVRAWRPRTPFTAAELELLRTRPGRGDRSEAATRAASVLIRHGVRSWAEARPLYKAHPVFAKFSARPDGGRAHWAPIAASGCTYRAPLQPAHRAACEAALDAAAQWSEPDLQAALVAIVVNRFMDGRGVHDRPVAVRDLAMWMGCSSGTAHGLLRDLRVRGAIRRVREWADGPACEASRYSLGAQFRALEDIEQDHTPLGRSLPAAARVLAPVWRVLGHSARAVYGLLDASGVGVDDLVSGSGLLRGRWGRSGVLLQLARLEAAGLVRRAGARWRRSSVSLEAAGRAVGAGEVSAVLGALFAAERAAWHAADEAERRAAAAELSRVRAELRGRFGVASGGRLLAAVAAAAISGRSGAGGIPGRALSTA